MFADRFNIPYGVLSVTPLGAASLYGSHNFLLNLKDNYPFMGISSSSSPLRLVKRKQHSYVKFPKMVDKFSFVHIAIFPTQIYRSPQLHSILFSLPSVANFSSR
jgi:hypothetical protein